jgi:hypothetical protein
MRFTVWTDDGCFFLRGERLEEHGDVEKGPRYQGPFDELEAIEDTIWYDYIPNNLEPDTLAIICFMLFFPWIGHTVEFPKPVSKKIEIAINHSTYHRFKGNIKVINIADTQTNNTEIKNELKDVRCEELAISFGGGVDSSALHALFPEATLIHEVNVENRTSIGHRAVVRSMKIHNEERKTPVEFIQTNARHVSKPKGVTNWLAPLIPALMVACDRNLKCLLIGSNTGTMFLKDGLKFSPGHTMKNPARELMSSLTVPIVQASGGISVANGFKICNEINIVQHAISCESGLGAGPCSKCMKCFRRELVYRGLHHSSPDGFNLEDLPIETDTFLEKYNLERLIQHLSTTENAPYTHNFAISRDLMGESFPKELLPICRNAPNSTFMLNRPSEADVLFPSFLYKYVLPRIHKKIPLMSQKEHTIFLNWDSSRPF